MEDVMESVKGILMIYGLKIVAAIVIFIIGRWVAKFIEKLIQKMMDKKEVDPTISAFVGNLSHITLMVFVVLDATLQFWGLRKLMIIKRKY